MELQAVYEELHNTHMCKSAYDFSTDYLGKSKSYYSVLKASKAVPSIEALSMLENALSEKAIHYDNRKYEAYNIKRKQLSSLSNTVGAMRNERCVAKLKAIDSELLL